MTAATASSASTPGERSRRSPGAAGDGAVDIDPSVAFFIVLNGGSGHNDTETTRATIARVLDEAGRKHHIEVVTDGSKLVDVARATVKRAQAENGVVVAAGGDGTINTIAQATLGSGRPFAVLPQGTFNYFSRTHGITSDTEQATRLMLNCRAHPVQVGLINDRLFLVNASLGLYPKLLQDREAYKKQYGRSRLVALWAALATIFGKHRQLDLLFEDGGPMPRQGTAKAQRLAGGTGDRMRTPTLFVGNNRLQMEQVGLPEAPRLDEGELAAVMLKPVGALALLWLVLRSAAGRLGDADDVVNFAFHSITVTPAGSVSKRGMKVATDGEVLRMQPPLHFRVAAESLLLIKPEPGQDRVDPDTISTRSASSDDTSQGSPT
ncbi:MAG: diacylglycerol kinase [Rhizobacter sp.]|nr:diacylglycerol kinase [Rhizobacter sp.]